MLGKNKFKAFNAHIVNPDDKFLIEIDDNLKLSEFQIKENKVTSLFKIQNSKGEIIKLSDTSYYFKSIREGYYNNGEKYFILEKTNNTQYLLYKINQKIYLREFENNVTIFENGNIIYGDNYVEFGNIFVLNKKGSDLTIWSDNNNNIEFKDKSDNTKYVIKKYDHTDNGGIILNLAYSSDIISKVLIDEDYNIFSINNEEGKNINYFKDILYFKINETLKCFLILDEGGNLYGLNGDKVTKILTNIKSLSEKKGFNNIINIKFNSGKEIELLSEKEKKEFIGI